MSPGRLPAQCSWAIIAIITEPGRRELSDSDPIVQPRPWASGAMAEAAPARQPAAARGPEIAFDRRELRIILSVYGSKVAQGEWRDYAIDFNQEKAVFSVFRRTSEVPLYRIEKQPRLAFRQGAYAVIAQGGMILRRGHDLAQVLRVLVRPPRLMAV